MSIVDALPRLLTFTVRDRPAPQGSYRHFKNGGMAPMSPHLASWREAVKTAARDAAGGCSEVPMFVGPVSVEVTFSLARPASHFGTGRNARVVKASAPAWPARTPDVDKLVRGVFDAVSAAGNVWGDDALVVEVTGRKVWVDGGWGALSLPGCVVRIVPAQTHDYRQESDRG